MKIRLCFSKSGALKFIGHLDFLRVVQQTIRRAGLPAAFSQGFNPHLLISFALPLPLGMESANDYADLTLLEEIPSAEIVQKLNAAAPVGLDVKVAYPAGNKAASVVAVADYALSFPHENNAPEDYTSAIEKILYSETIIIPKKTKKGVKDTDIRPDILSINMEKNRAIMRLSAGSSRFLHPLTMAEILFAEADLQEKPSAANLIRLELYQSTESGGLATL